MSFRDIFDSMAPSTSTWPLVGSSRLPAIVSRVLLPDPLGPVHGHQRAGVDGQVHVAEGLHLGRPFAVDLRNAAQLKDAHRPHHHPPPWSGHGWNRRYGRPGPGVPETAIGGVKPAHHRVQAEQLGIDRQREAETGLGLVFLEARPLLHQLHQVPAVRLDHLTHVHAGQLPGHQDLDDQLIARRQAQVQRCPQPRGKLLLARGRDPEALLRPVGVGGVSSRFDQPVALESLPRAVNLADVEGPRPRPSAPRIPGEAGDRTSAPRSASRAGRAGR